MAGETTYEAVYPILTDDDIDAQYGTASQAGIANWSLGQILWNGRTGPVETHLATEILIYMKKVGSPQDIIVEFREATATTISNKVIGKGSIEVSSVTTSMSWVPIVISKIPTIKENSYYAIVLKCGSVSVSNDYIFRAFPNGIANLDDYPRTRISKDGGKIWGIATGSGLGDGTNTFSFLEYSDTNCVIYFQELGGEWDNQVMEYEELIKLVGAGANETAKGTENASIYASNAEGYINAITKYDWGANWTKLDEKAKKIVKEAMMCLAAVNIVNFDITGYTSRFEAQYISDSLQYRSDKAVAALLDMDIQSYIKGEE